MGGVADLQPVYFVAPLIAFAFAALDALYPLCRRVSLLSAAIFSLTDYERD